MQGFGQVANNAFSKPAFGQPTGGFGTGAPAFGAAGGGFNTSAPNTGFGNNAAPAAAGGFGGGFGAKPFGTTGGFGAANSNFSKPATQQQSLQLADVGAELIDASVNFNLKLQPQRQIHGLNQSQMSQLTTSCIYGGTSGFQSQQKSTQNFTESKSVHDIMHASFIAKLKQPKTPQNITKVENPQKMQKLTFRNMFGQIEFLEMLEVPSGFQVEDYVDIKHGFVGLKNVEQCSQLMGQKARVSLFNVYPDDGENALKKQCQFLGAQHESYNDGVWQFVFEMM